MSSQIFPKSFAVERSDSPATSGVRSSTKKPRPILRDLRNTLALQAAESGRYNIEQGVPLGASSFSVTESPSSPEHHRHHHGNGKYRVSLIAFPITPHTAPLNILGSAPVDALAFHFWNRDTPLEEENIFNIKRNSSMITSYSDHGNLNIDNTFSPLESKHVAIHQSTQALRPRRVPPNVVDQKALVFTIPPCSPTLSLSPPAASSSPISDLLSKRSGRTFRLVPTQNDHFVHAVATDLTDRIENPLDSPCSSSSSPTHFGFPPDMLELLQELDKLAGWVQDFPYPEEASGALDILTIGSAMPVSCPHALQQLGNDLGDHFLQQPVLSDKGKRRRMTESTDDDLSELKCQFPTSHSAIPPASTPIVRRGSVRYIYEPRGTPSFLVGSSTSPVAYPAEGYRSPPREVITPGPTSPITSLTAGTPVIRTFGRRSVPNVSLPPMVSPPTGMPSFKAFFKRSRSNTMSAPRSNTLVREKKKFGWLKI